MKTRAEPFVVVSAILLAVMALVLGVYPAAMRVSAQTVDSQFEPPIVDSPQAQQPDLPTTPAPLGKGSVLPWNRPSEDVPKPPRKRLSSPREMLDLFGIDESQLNQFVDSRPLHADEEETLLKLLYRVPQFGRDKIEAWQRIGVAWSELASAPETYRIEVFQAQGRVLSLEKVPLQPETASRFEFRHYYRVRFQLHDASNPVLLCCRDVPQAWEDAEVIDERASFLGLFLKTGEPDGEHPELVFAAQRLAWMPDRVEPEKGIDASHVLLGDLGMDVGLFDDVRQTNRAAMSSHDRECFYQLLAAVGRAKPSTLFPQANKPIDLEAMLVRPETQHGRLFRVNGSARRIQRILVDDEDIQERFGIDHYYQIDVFMPLRDQEVRLGEDRPDKDAPVFRNHYPVTCCVLRLPDGLDADGQIRQQVSLAGFFFKLWAYKTEFVSGFNPGQRQPGPMLVATTPRLVIVKRSVSPVWGWVGGVGFTAVLLAIFLGSWLYRRSDKRFEQDVLRHQFEVKQGESLNDAGIEASDGPDFSGLG